MFMKSSEGFSIYVLNAFTVNMQSVLIHYLLMISTCFEQRVYSSCVHVIVLYETNNCGSIVILMSVYDMGQMTTPHLLFSICLIIYRFVLTFS